MEQANVGLTGLHWLDSMLIVGTMGAWAWSIFSIVTTVDRKLYQMQVIRSLPDPDDLPEPVDEDNAHLREVSDPAQSFTGRIRWEPIRSFNDHAAQAVALTEGQVPPSGAR